MATKDPRLGQAGVEAIFAKRRDVLPTYGSPIADRRSTRAGVLVRPPAGGRPERAIGSNPPAGQAAPAGYLQGWIYHLGRAVQPVCAELEGLSAAVAVLNAAIKAEHGQSQSRFVFNH